MAMEEIMPTGRQRMEALGFVWSQVSAYYPGASNVPHLHIGVPYSGTNNNVDYISYKQSDNPRRVYQIYSGNAWSGNAHTVIGTMGNDLQTHLNSFLAAYSLAAPPAPPA
jgi:hypothetical protein